jgi:hypothetical protein
MPKVNPLSLSLRISEPSPSSGSDMMTDERLMQFDIPPGEPKGVSEDKSASMFS